jgi:4,5-dihydroxyphthalate decarboxylase
MIKLSMACSDYDITSALVSGKVRPQGIDLTVVPLMPHERQMRLSRYPEFDIAEFSIAVYLTSFQRPDFPYIGIPVFPLRCFRHGAFFVRSDSSIRTPADLRGKKVGVTGYVNSAAIWGRAALQHEYGVKASEVEWWTEGPEYVDWERPQDIQVQRSDVMVEDLLTSGKIDAILYPKVPPNFTPDGPIKRLIPDYKEREIAFFKTHGYVPIMHVVIVRKEVLESQPWVAWSMWTAFREAKRACLQSLKDHINYSSQIWLGHAVEEQINILGKDPFPYSIEENANCLRAAVQYAVEQGLLKNSVDISSLFFQTTKDAFLPGAVSRYRV